MRSAEPSQPLPSWATPAPLQQGIEVFSAVEQEGWDNAMEEDAEDEENRNAFVGPIRITGRWAQSVETEASDSSDEEGSKE